MKYTKARAAKRWPDVLFGGDVYIEAGATIETGAYIGARVYIGAEAIIGARATIAADAYVGAEVIIETGVTIGAGAIIGAGAYIEAGATIETEAYITAVCSKYVGNIVPMPDNQMLIRIGCEIHPPEQWRAYGDKLAEAHCEVEWWNQYGKAMLAFLLNEAEQYQKQYGGGK